MTTNSLVPGLATTCLVLLICLFAGGSVAAADDSYVPVYHPELKISRAAGPIKIDGDLSDPGWRGAARAANFAEHSPGNQTKPAVDTEAFITYRINSLTMFYVGSTHNYRDLNMEDDAQEGWTLTDRQFFMKLQYLFQI